MADDRPEIAELEEAAAWRLRLVDAQPEDAASQAAARRLEAVADDLRRNEYPALWTELRSIGHWLGESGAISDYADLAALYRARIGISEHPENGAAYLRRLLAIAREVM